MTTTMLGIAMNIAECCRKSPATGARDAISLVQQTSQIGKLFSTIRLYGQSTPRSHVPRLAAASASFFREPGLPRRRLTRNLRTPKDAPRFIAIHEFDNLAALDGPELRSADSTEWTKKNLSTAKKVVVRAFKLVEAFGY